MRANPIIVALDVETRREAIRIVDRLGDGVDFYKVGLELYAAAGMEFVHELQQARKQVFLDLKFYDIGETVKRAVARVAEVGVHLLTVHGSRAVMEAAAAGRGSGALKLLAVTVLTSFDESDLVELGYPCKPAELVALRVKNAMASRMDGLVCSPLEVAEVRATTGPCMLLVTPGVRSAGSAAGDQKRVATPLEAVRGGADYLVMGRQITRAQDPAGEVKRVLEELRSASG